MNIVEVQIADTILCGDSHPWGNAYGYSIGVNTYQDTILSSLGCDSAELELTLMVGNTQEFEYESIICGDSLFWRDNWYYPTIDTTYQESYLSVLGCDSALFTMSVTISPYQPSICVVTDSDNNGTNEVEFTMDGQYDYMLLRGSTIIDTIAADVGFTSYDDVGVSNQEFAYEYSIRAIQGGGCDLSEPSPEHKTIHLRDNGGNLEWNDYEGLSNIVGLVYSLRRSNQQVTDEEIFTIPMADWDGSVDAYSPIDHQEGDIYQIVLDPQLNCSPNRTASFIKSNEVILPLGEEENFGSENILLVNNGLGLNLTLPRKMNVKVVTATGQTVRQYFEVNQVIDQSYPNGIYLVTAFDDNSLWTERLVVSDK